MQKSRIILTNMCMLYRDDGSFLVQMREKNDWPGLNFPGGHVEDGESIEESVVREMKEETGLMVADLEEVGHIEWNLPQEGVRHLCVLFRTKSFSGALAPSKEGAVFFIKKDEVGNYPLSTDFTLVLAKMQKGLRL